MPLNKTQATDLAVITGTDDYTQWPKTAIILTPDQHNDKDTIKITASPHPAPMTAPLKREPEEILKELYT